MNNIKEMLGDNWLDLNLDMMKNTLKIVIKNIFQPSVIILSIEARYVNNFLCEKWWCKIFPTTVFPMTWPFVRQFFWRHDRFDDKSICATIFPMTSPFVWQFFQRQARLCEPSHSIVAQTALSHKWSCRPKNCCTNRLVIWKTVAQMGLLAEKLSHKRSCRQKCCRQKNSHRNSHVDQKIVAQTVVSSEKFRQTSFRRKNCRNSVTVSILSDL